MALNSLGLALNSPGLALNSPGLALNSPGLALNSPGLALNSPGLALVFSEHIFLIVRKAPPEVVTTGSKSFSEDLYLRPGQPQGIAPTFCAQG
ncbi:MAG: hypothetical protein ACPGWR_32910, partial [Ardenticatenaceae bacterium]